MPTNWSASEAAGWMRMDGQAELLDLPRRIAGTIVASEGPLETFLDIASGPGAFLKVFLEMFPDSRGIWHDSSPTMRKAAEESLKDFRSRITWLEGDMSDLSALNLPTRLDAVLTSRATHHFDTGELEAFYAESAKLVRPGGWIVNLDHTFVGEHWDPIFRTARKQLIPKKQAEDAAGGHKHTRPAPTLEDHVSALSKAGITQVVTAWQAFYSFLMIAKCP